MRRFIYGTVAVLLTAAVASVPSSSSASPRVASAPISAGVSPDALLSIQAITTGMGANVIAQEGGLPGVANAEYLYLTVCDEDGDGYHAEGLAQHQNSSGSWVTDEIADDYAGTGSCNIVIVEGAVANVYASGTKIRVEALTVNGSTPEATKFSPTGTWQ